MARATIAEIKKLFLGGWPPGVTDAKVTDLLPGIDYKFDGYVRKHYKTTLSTTDTSVIHISNMIGKQEVLHGLWSLGGGTLTRQPEPRIFTDEIIAMIEAVLSDTDSDGAVAIDLQGSSSNT